MKLITKMVTSLRSSRIGESIFTLARAVTHGARQLRHPEIPVAQQISTVSIGNTRFAFLHRRTEADASVLRQIFREKQYDMSREAHGKFLQTLYQRTVDAGLTPLIIDCGANIGASVVWFASRYPRAHIVAIEPAPDNFALLQHNTKGLSVDLRQAGLAAADGSAYLCHMDEDGWAYRTSPTELTDEGPAIEMVSLGTVLASKLAAKYVPLILKIDIEGAETSLFDADPSSFNRFPVIVIEPHDWMLPGQRSSCSFFEFHTATRRELCVKGENLFSFAWSPELQNPANQAPSPTPAPA